MISHFLVPPGGWKFKQGNYWIHADSWGELVKNVHSHREINNLGIGNVEDDIDAQLEGLHPTIVINK